MRTLVISNEDQEQLLDHLRYVWTRQKDGQGRIEIERLMRKVGNAAPWNVTEVADKEIIY